MKGIDLLCSSPASTAICTSMAPRHSHGGRKLDRHNPHLRDNRRAKPTTTTTNTTTNTNTNNNTSSSSSPPKLQPHNSTKPNNNKQHKNNKNHKTWKSNNTSTKSSSKQQQDMLISGSSPSGSSRYLLSNSVFFDMVVVLRVSLHCKGCEGKVRKHISRMKGVKSFNIDFQAKKVTVIGDVTPVGVLASISRVKRAQFWHSPSPLSVTTKL
ncbi:hypothetical protein Scep_015738 [Stephania cephalantha]|uniref:HMA domain-containing protein n=1 Tax=Stephania cephalantha TaxID=152367 RepID=A0AAP0P0P3_9MAGN